MNLREMQVKKVIEVEIGEEKLHQVYNFENEEKTVDMIVGVDGGSTQTRVNILTREELDIQTQYIIPSNHVVLKDQRELKPKSEELIDRLDSFIVNQNPSVDEKIGRERLVRATKLNDTGLSPISISSTMQKIQEPIFYLNIIDGIGYAILQKYGEKVPTKVNVVAGVALPPDDMSSTKNINTFKKYLMGSYQWSHQDSGVKVEINIIDVELATEPEAFVKAYYAVLQEEVPEVVLCINTGGRSTGVEILKDGKILGSTSQTFEYGGNQFLSEVGKIYNNENGGRVPSQDLLAKAVKTGKLKNGNSTIDIVPNIKEACEIFAERIFMDVVKKVCDFGGIPLEAINTVIMCGGLARGGTYEISIADFLATSFEQKSPNTEFIVVEENMIPTGLAFSTFNEHADMLMSEEDEEIAVDEDVQESAPAGR